MNTPLRALLWCGLLVAAGVTQAAAPVGVDDDYQTQQGEDLTVAAPGVLANDTDADGDPLTATVVSNPGNGLLMLQPNGAFTYTPDGSFYGDDSFSYQANDGTADSNVTVVSLTVTRYGDTGGGGYSSGYGGAMSPGLLVMLALGALYRRGLKLAKRRSISP